MDVSNTQRPLIDCNIIMLRQSRSGIGARPERKHETDTDTGAESLCRPGGLDRPFPVDARRCAGYHVKFSSW
jgi:hypothetical protein